MSKRKSIYKQNVDDVQNHFDKDELRQKLIEQNTQKGYDVALANSMIFKTSMVKVFKKHLKTLREAKDLRENILKSLKKKTSNLDELNSLKYYYIKMNELNSLHDDIKKEHNNHTSKLKLIFSGLLDRDDMYERLDVNVFLSMYSSMLSNFKTKRDILYAHIACTNFLMNELMVNSDFNDDDEVIMVKFIKELADSFNVSLTKSSLERNREKLLTMLDQYTEDNELNAEMLLLLSKIYSLLK
jgi:hypothetical protein